MPVHALTIAERAAILAVYAAYDQLLGQPNHNLLPVELAGCRAHLEDAYSQVQIGGRLESLRGQLLATTDVCPYCGFGEPTQLDHYLPISEYGELAIYPRNLVPSCGPCNNAKRAHIAVAGPGFIHAYFQQLPAQPFFHADVIYDAGALDVTFHIDEGALGAALAQRLRFQLARLKLNDRYPKQINKFLSEQRPGIMLLQSLPNSSQQLATYFMGAAATLSPTFGINDWRPALLRALATTLEFCADPEAYYGQKPAVPGAA
jgi:hypothetical protein